MITAKRVRRPFTVTLLALGVLTIAGLNLVRFILSVLQWDFLASMPTETPLYLVLTGFIWVAAGAPLVWGLWSGKVWGPTRCRAFSLAYTVYFWLERLFLFGRPHDSFGPPSLSYMPGNGLFSALATLLILAFVFWILGRPGAQKYFVK